ncbi:MAG: hypothetical protein R3E02_08275 [Blastomonas sp.]
MTVSGYSARASEDEGARHYLGMRIGRLPELARRGSLREMVVEMDRLRRIADRHHLPCLSDIAHQVEALAAHGWSRTMAAHYFSAMDDALRIAPDDRAAQQALLASIAIHRGF